MAQASATNTSSKRSEFYLRYQPNFEIGTEYTATVTFVATKDMSLKLGNLSADVENIVQFTANEEGTISNTFTVSDDMPLNIQLIFGEINEGDDPVTCTVKKVELTPVEA